MKLIKLTYLNTNIGWKEIKKFIYPVHFIEIIGKICLMTIEVKKHSVIAAAPIFIKNTISVGVIEKI